VKLGLRKKISELFVKKRNILLFVPEVSRATMPYVFVRESVFKWLVAVQGLNHNEVRQISEKVQEQPEFCSDKDKRTEFSVPSWQVLNGLEVMGYKVISCGSYMTGDQRHDQREFVWTLFKNKEEWDGSSK